MSDIPEYPYDVSVITPYEEKHYYENQKVFDDGIPIDPVQRADFDCTPNELRDPRENQDWWGRAFIVTFGWKEATETWSNYKARSKEVGFSPVSEEEFTQRHEDQERSWFDAWPTGTRYDVRRLDGGAWDRSTDIAMVPSMEQALSTAKECG